MMYRHFLKRFFDILLSACALLVLSPVLAVLALLVRSRLGAPVIFAQERPGLHEKPFRLYKFRSMTDARDESGALLPDDKRLPPFGRKLRATSLDELPELWNILRGDMSLVGPRPLLMRDLPYMTAEQRTRHNVRPGLTGLAQVSGRNALNWDEKLALDAEYVKNYGFIHDCGIMLKTAAKVFRHENVEGADEHSASEMDLKDWLAYKNALSGTEDV